MKYMILILFILLLAGCAENPEAQSAESALAESQTKPVSTSTSQPEADESPVIAAGNAEGFPFEYKGQIIYVGVSAEPIVRQLGEPQNYFEAPSCAFNGIDKTYFYSGIELHTFPLDDKDYVLAVVFTDDSVETPDGVYLGISAKDAIAILGDGYEENGGQYTYVKGQGSLSVMTENNVVIDLSYHLLVGE